MVVRYVVPERTSASRHLAACCELLSEDELRRLERFVRASDRQRFAVSHALVRRALSEQVEVDPGDWQFAAGERGRPEVIAPAAGRTLRFSLSHTRGMSACAVTVADDVGIDVERVTREVDADRIARRMFSREEVDRLSRMDPAARQVAFLRHWTLREAWVKAQGEGMLRVQREAISFRVGGRAGDRIEADAKGWRFFLRMLEGSHVCAVAHGGGEPSAVTLSAGRWSPIQPSGSSSAAD